MAIKVGIIGYKGFVGSAFYSAFSEDKKYSVTGIDKKNYASHAGKEFGILINANGNSSKRLAEAEPEKDWEMNVEATKKMLHDFPSRHYIHLSSVEVYNDKSKEASTREDVKINSARLSNYGKSKYAGEQIARSHPSFLILRLAGMVGKNMKKGPAFDILFLHRLFISEKSELHFMNTASVASIAKALSEKGKWSETYNVVGKRSIRLGEFAAIVDVRLQDVGQEMQRFNISSSKLGKQLAVPSTLQEIRDFVKQVR